MHKIPKMSFWQGGGDKYLQILVENSCNLILIFIFPLARVIRIFMFIVYNFGGEGLGNLHMATELILL